MKQVIFLACFFAFIANASAQKILAYTYNLDTITNTESDTIYIGSSSTGAMSGAIDFQSLFAGRFQFTRTSISGTANVALKVESTLVYTGTSTEWVSVATGSGTGATAEYISLSEMGDRRYRVILTGSGTQSTSYRVRFVGKKKN